MLVVDASVAGAACARPDGFATLSEVLGCVITPDEL